ncbi:MAG: GTPase Era [Patescibacteria group bacterium]|jgi:GTP-binding protein Era
MKSGFAAIVGRSNVGKSTLLNTIVGTKVAITTPKPQTTRRPIQGIVTKPEGQIVFVDTPGFMQKAKDPLTKKLTQYIENALAELDVVVYVVDPTRDIGDEEKKMLQIVRGAKKPTLLVINKIDDKEAERFLDFYRDLSKNFDQTIEVSAMTGFNTNLIVTWILAHLPEGELLYPGGECTNLTMEERIAELIREKLYLRLRDEVPYSVSVQVEEIDERPDGTVYIKAVIFTSEKRYERMIVGQGGRGIKEIGQSTRHELEAVSDRKVYLDLRVETDSHWIERME